MELIDRIEEFMSGTASFLAVDTDGSLLSADDGEPGATATLYVRRATDALKIVDSGSVVGSVDRETIWEVVGYRISRAVGAALLSKESFSADLLEEVPALGFDWVVTEKVAGP